MMVSQTDTGAPRHLTIEDLAQSLSRSLGELAVSLLRWGEGGVVAEISNRCNARRLKALMGVEAPAGWAQVVL